MIQDTMNPANEVMKPSFMSSQIPPYSSSSICWKLMQYTYTIPQLIKPNLQRLNIGLGKL